jgi:hypothetical protein
LRNRKKRRESATAKNEYLRQESKEMRGREKKKEGTGCEGNRSIKEDEVMRRGMRRR